ncbi:hypothetical protein EMM73_13070 [Rheinheimera sediminis]|uniref:hypothetical protein n=1 Tax=Rheinheimera sp. YQF-1 TaxID=2499626 RepID=UPI000FDBBB08|nr:hypothetical protein [Rheinheimera sp. YQF-1]RVT45631.1 hypothetical protein EMM73_13070 [Rheinheimera sp. YQF-1]
MSSVKKVIILDDDLAEPTIMMEGANEKIAHFLNDQGSKEFTETIQYIEKNEFVNDIDDIDAIQTFVNSSDFVEKVLLKDDYKNLFDGAFHEHLKDFSDVINNRLNVFKPFFTVFGSENFQLSKTHKRPVSPDELTSYDVIIMDIMMGDSFDSEFIKLAEYIGNVCRRGNYPSVFLISSRDELDDEKETFRVNAKISSIGFSIIKKSDLLHDNAELTIQLIYEQMNKARSSNKSLSEFTNQLELAIKQSTINVLKSLWNIDYSYIQQMYACLDNENVPFAEHFLNIITSNMLFNLEASSSLHTAISDVKSIISGDAERFCSYSKDSDIAIHNFEASLHFVGTKTEDITCASLCTSTDQLGKEIVNILPFGLLLAEGNLSVGSRALIHCTQQCDLSRNIIKSSINLIFVEGRILNYPNKEFCIPLPTNISKTNQRLWLEVDSKKVLAWPYSGMSRYIIENKFKSLSIVRPDVVRQIRSNLFQQMSRREESVKTGHNASFGIKIAIYNNSTTAVVLDYNETNDIRKILLYEFPDQKSKEKTFHFLDHSHIDVINWIYQNSGDLLKDLSFKAFEDILKSKLPKIGKKATAEKTEFMLLDDADKVSEFCKAEKSKRKLVRVIFYKFN